jgi:hypothetical protein
MIHELRGAPATRSQAAIGTSWVTGLLFLVAIVATDALSGLKERMTEFTMTDRRGVRFTLRFGTDPHATDGFDIALGEVPIPPPPPPGNFELRFLDRPNMRRIPGDGSYVDIRPIRAKTQIDTFIVHFQSPADGFPLTFSWSHPSDCDSMFVECKEGRKKRRVDMLKDHALEFEDENESRLIIIKYGHFEEGAVGDPSGFRRVPPGSAGE